MEEVTNDKPIDESKPAETVTAIQQSESSGSGGGGGGEKETPSEVKSKSSTKSTKSTKSTASNAGTAKAPSSMGDSPVASIDHPLTSPSSDVGGGANRPIPSPSGSSTSTRKSSHHSGDKEKPSREDKLIETIEGVFHLGSDTDDSEDHDNYQPIDLVRLLIPVSLCMLLTMLMTILVTAPGKQPQKVQMALTPFDSEDADTGTKAWQTAANVGILLGVVVAMTILIVVLYYCYCYKVLMVIMAIPVIVVNLIFTWAYLHRMMRAFNAPIDHITAAFISFNFGAIGIVSILGRTPMRLQQFYLIYLCAVMANLYISYMPDWTVWAFLAVLAIWDLFAVLTPCGPLKILVETVQTREHDFIPAMIYTTAVYMMAKGDGEEKKKETKQVKTQKSKIDKKKTTKKEKKGKGSADHSSGSKDSSGDEKKEKRRLRLGLGDFVFYSLLMGKATHKCIAEMHQVDWNIILACYLAILCGLMGTIVLLVLAEQALPALPISILFGLIFFVTSYYVFGPQCNFLSYYMIHM